MPRYRSLVNHNGMSAGQTYEVHDAEIARWQDEIDMGFLVREFTPDPLPTFPDEDDE